jgi:type IV secretory pathway protease TraF
MTGFGWSFNERLVVTGLAAQIAVACGLLIDRVPPTALVNESPSLARGVYLRDWGGAPVPGAVVAFTQPRAARDHLRRWGMPPDVLLLKRVAAVGGDGVCHESGTLRTPSRAVVVRLRDGGGSPLPRWTGCRRLEDGELFVLGDSETSFDSRYFGPVRVEQLTGVYREVVRW